MHPWRERVWASPLVRRRAVKRWLSHLYTSVLPVLSLPSGQLSGFFFYTWSRPTLGPSLGCVHTPQPRWISKWRLLGGARLITAWHYPLNFDLQGAFLRIVSSLSQKERGSLNCLLKQGPCHDYYLKVFTRDKHWLFTLFLLLLLFWRANGRLIVNTFTGAHLSLVSENANSFKYPVLLLRAPGNVKSRPVVNV